ncbi:WhiB family transcriptional regulator [Streptomyces sp. PTM05]|uniref:Transcriptional regulator WhiB n=1 Tax=Streptantibioticus parmotrematis TaxID=2873249 RepID=A0ABS7QXF3_9ACTN|nr:WhiB family transcriptional regulator [Streptantibioticus parmotrematis]MBY8887040.1 WhiB family transcriptional regulator [Streptantibioticus parmotrematis]
MRTTTVEPNPSTITLGMCTHDVVPSEGNEASARPACQDADPLLFFPEGRREDNWRIGKAKAICAACPVIRACLLTAIRQQDNDGIWGGCTPAERRALVRDVRGLRRDVKAIVRRLEEGARFPVRRADFLAVVHQLTRFGWGVEDLADAMGVRPQSVIEARLRAHAAAPCDGAVPTEMA